MKLALALALLGLTGCTDPTENFIGTYKTTLTLMAASSQTYADTVAISEGQTADLIITSAALGSMKATIIGDTSFSVDQQQITLQSSTGAVSVTAMGQGTVNDGVLAASGMLSSSTGSLGMTIAGSRQ